MEHDMDSIVLGCQRRDPQSQRRLYDALAPQMLGLCMRYVRCREDAQDVLHDGFIAVFQRIGELRDPAAVRSWVSRIMVNRAINSITRNSEQAVADMEAMRPDMADEPLDTDSFCLLEVMEAVQQLPDLYRAAFNMHDVEQMPYADMAAATGLTEAAMRSAVCRARRMLRDRLLQKANDEKND